MLWGGEDGAEAVPRKQAPEAITAPPLSRRMSKNFQRTISTEWPSRLSWRGRGLPAAVVQAAAQTAAATTVERARERAAERAVKQAPERSVHWPRRTPPATLASGKMEAARAGLMKGLPVWRGGGSTMTARVALLLTGSCLVTEAVGVIFAISGKGTGAAGALVAGSGGGDRWTHADSGLARRRCSVTMYENVVTLFLYSPQPNVGNCYPFLLPMFLFCDLPVAVVRRCQALPGISRPLRFFTPRGSAEYVGKNI